VAQSWAATWHPLVGSLGYAKYGVSTGVEPPTSSKLRTGRTGLTTRSTGVLNSHMEKIYLSLIKMFSWRRKGLGLSPSPWFHYIHVTIYPRSAGGLTRCAGVLDRAIPWGPRHHVTTSIHNQGYIQQSGHIF
jgi:hypothetical protein